MYIGNKLESGPIDMAVFNPADAALVANKHLKSIDDPRRRQILINFRDHALAEAVGDHAALMATCSRQSQWYEAYGASPDFQAMQPDSYDTLLDYYKTLIELNMYLIHSQIEKLIVGSDCLLAELMVHQVFSGRQAIDFFGVADADPDTIYQGHTRTAVIFTFDKDGLGNGEQAYAGDGSICMARMTALKDEEVPPQFHSGPLKVADYFSANPDLDWPNS